MKKVELGIIRIKTCILVFYAVENPPHQSIYAAPREMLCVTLKRSGVFSRKIVVTVHSASSIV
eukprot:snap_masked-scaffold_10-processed-gene-12.24-mRNA-1 protein AED:1.00 eAED:1.00 QI:0/-1/0/0/-1/1/1/0/62